jgi:hypothetical protein
VGNFIIGGAWTRVESIVNVKSPSEISGTGEGVVDLEVCSPPSDVGALGAIQTGPANKDGIFPIAIIHEEGVAGIGEYNCETGKSYVGSWLVPGTVKGMISATPLACSSTALEPVAAPSDFSPLFADECGNCATVHDGPGCTNATCTIAVCSISMEIGLACCNDVTPLGSWTQTCVDAVLNDESTKEECAPCRTGSAMGGTVLPHLFTIAFLSIGWALF